MFKSCQSDAKKFLSGREKKNEKKYFVDIDSDRSKKPSCIIILGMAGSGKTTFVKRIVSELFTENKPYVINLDPACLEVPYPVNIGKQILKSNT